MSTRQQLRSLRFFCLIFIVLIMSDCDSRQLQSTSESDYWPTEGWKESAPEYEEMDSNRLLELRQFIEKSMPHITSVLIVRHGRLVFDYYPAPSTREKTRLIQSATKSFTSALIGIALQEGFLNNLDQKVIEFFPEYNTPDIDPRLRNVTLRHLLTFTAGFARPNSFGEPPPIKIKIQEGMMNEPGQSFAYDDGATQLLTVILTKATQMSALEFADKYLFEPLGISTVSWSKDSYGYNIGGHGLVMLSSDIAKLGYLYLNNGIWDDRQIVPSDYIKNSTQKQSEGGPPENDSYGYQWWVTTIKGHKAYYASGYGGQYLYVIPDLDMVVVITSQSDRHHGENKSIINTFVVPAVLK